MHVDHHTREFGIYDKIEGDDDLLQRWGIRLYAAANDENENGNVEGKGKGRKVVTKQEGFVATE